jgi:hypothetical protein
MKDTEQLDHVVAKLTTLSVKYNSLGGSLDDAALVKKLFDIVPERYLTVVAGIEQFFDLKTLAFNEAVGRRRRSRSTRSGAAAAQDLMGRLCSRRWSGRLGSGEPVVTLPGKGREETATGEAVVVAVAAGVVAVSTTVMPGEMALGSVTRVTSSASNVTSMGTMPIGVPKRRKEMKHTGERRRNRLCYWPRLCCRASYSTVRKAGFRRYF